MKYVLYSIVLLLAFYVSYKADGKLGVIRISILCCSVAAFSVLKYLYESPLSYVALLGGFYLVHLFNKKYNFK